jgi:hypothetical protein
MTKKRIPGAGVMASVAAIAALAGAAAALADTGRLHTDVVVSAPVDAPAPIFTMNGV